MSTCHQGRPVLDPAPLNSVDLRQAFRDALRAIDLSEKAASIQMGIDQAQLSRGLSGEGHLHLDRMPLLGDAFQRAFLVGWAEALGLRIVAPDPERETLRRLLHQVLDLMSVPGER
jgi:hypothetical protein